MPSNRSQILHVPGEQSGFALSAAIKHQLADQSWGAVRKLIRSRRIQVNGNLCLDEGRRLKEGDVIKVLQESAPRLPTEHDLRILYLDAHLVVVEKPSGITSVRHSEEMTRPAHRRQFQPTLDELLPKAIAKMERRKNQKGRLPPVRAVHRIDRETSGLIVFARTRTAETDLVRQFRNHTVHRRYTAVIPGTLQAQTIRSRLIRDRGDGRRGSTDNPQSGKESITHVMPIKKLPGGYTVIECRLETGRTHQIRIHLSELGHPLCGEKIYNRQQFKTPFKDQSGAERLALHAGELGFTHPHTGERLDFVSPLPPDMQRLIQSLSIRRPTEEKSF